jgi:hypothetical protein
MWQAEGCVHKSRINLRVIPQNTFSWDRMASVYMCLGYQEGATLPGKKLSISIYRRAMEWLAISGKYRRVLLRVVALC